jgi:dienelactone hydrolase
MPENCDMLDCSRLAGAQRLQPVSGGMNPIRIILPLLLLISGCGEQTAEQSPSGSRAAGAKSPSANPVSLVEARKNFKTKLIREESAGEPLKEPPPDLFQVVYFTAAGGELGAYLTPDPKDGKKSPAIIWITGGDCSTIDDNTWQEPPPGNDQTARQFREAGIVTMFPSLRGGNENPGFHEGFFGEVDDVISAAEFLSRQKFVDPKRIYLGGHSSGATMVLLAAECSERFRAVFSVSPTHDIRSYPPRFNRLFQPFDTSNPREFELRAPGRWLHSIQVPTFVFAGSVNDGAFLAVDVMTRTSTNPKVRFFVVRGANHFDILAPTNRIIAAKILRDAGPQCSITLTNEELDKPFAN